MMKSLSIYLFKFSVIFLAAFPAFTLAAPPATAPYYADTVNSYVQDQVSQDMESMNNLLCFLGGVAPHLMVNEGDYIALIDMNSCNSSGSGSQSSNTGIEYFAVQANSSRASNSTPMVSKIWYEVPRSGFTFKVPIYTTASVAPSKLYPYGVFRMDYCVVYPGVVCGDNVGFIDASRNGLSYYTSNTKSDGTYSEVALGLSASSSSNSGSGIVVKSNNSNGVFTDTATLFAYSDSYFYRDDGSLTGGASGQCFSRSLKNASESAWRYGLYYADTGLRFDHESGFPIEYLHTDGVNYNGYISYYGLSMSVMPPNGAVLNKISYNTNPPTKTPYKLLKTAGKLLKYSTNYKSLADLNKIPIWYYSRTGMSISPLIGTNTTPTQTITPANKYIEIYWDDTNKYFVVSSIQGSTGNMEQLKVPGYLLNSALVVDAGGSGINGWSQLLGGSFSIKGTEFATLTDGTPSNMIVITQTQDVVYPKDFAAITEAGGLKCTGDCPTSATIRNFISNYWATSSTLNNYNYILDVTSGNLNDATNAAVANIDTTVQQTGRLITNADITYILTQKPGLSCASVPCSQSDVDLLSNRLDTSGNPVPYSYYVWQTSSNYWDQMAFLYTGTDTTNTVNFYAPLPVKYTVPNTSKYGTLAGSSTILQYDQFGSLWGIPNKCVDIRTNVDCIFPAPSPSVEQAYYRWTPSFSIPFSLTEGVVTADIDQLPLISKGTQLLVKALDKEVRLANASKNICIALGLANPAYLQKLASYGDWLNPEAKVGTKAVLSPVPAPRVIHGVKQY